jgi:heme-degrading monooxygenase HmoA
MVMTVFEARVSEEQRGALEQRYRTRVGPEHLPPQLIRTYLVQSTSDPEAWQLITTWRSREDLQEYRRSVEAPEGVLLFRSVGAEPMLVIYNVVQETGAGG